MKAAVPVVFVSHQSGCGGAELSLLELLSGLDCELHPPLLVTSADGELSGRARALRVACEFVPMAARGAFGKLARSRPRHLRS